VLRLSPDLSVVSAGETKYMGGFLKPGFRAKIRKEVSRSATHDLERLANICIEGSPTRDVWNELKSGQISRKRLVDELVQVEYSEKGVYECILQLRAKPSEGKQLLIDKTPQNLYHVATLMTWFPDAKVIHMIRDPRAVLASDWTKRMREYPERGYFPFRIPRALYSLMIVFHVAITWRYAAHLDRRYRARFSENYLLIRFEDIVLEPESTIRRVAEWIGVTYEAAMAVPPSRGSSFESGNTSGMDKKTLDRWRVTLEPWMVLIVKAICGRAMKTFGYH
jgi:hypothetical protein